MAATTYQTKISYETDAPHRLSRVVSHLSELIEGAREGHQIEARYFELSQLSSAELARRGLQRPCSLAELMAQPAGHNPTGPK
jgi:hypothetical protein